MSKFLYDDHNNEDNNDDDAMAIAIPQVFCENCQAKSEHSCTLSFLLSVLFQNLESTQNNSTKT